jgi:hypothetical protein
MSRHPASEKPVGHCPPVTVMSGLLGAIDARPNPRLGTGAGCVTAAQRLAVFIQIPVSSHHNLELRVLLP